MNWAGLSVLIGIGAIACAIAGPWGLLVLVAFAVLGSCR
jgi:hypothetical protein